MHTDNDIYNIDVCSSSYLNVVVQSDFDFNVNFLNPNIPKFQLFFFFLLLVLEGLISIISHFLSRTDKK